MFGAADEGRIVEVELIAPFYVLLPPHCLAKLCNLAFVIDVHMVANALS